MYSTCIVPCYTIIYLYTLLLTHTVTNLKAVNTTTSSTTITWDQPPHNYRVFLHGEATDNIPQSRVIQLVNVTGQTTHVVKGLNSFRNYSIGAYLESKLGQGSSATVTFQTQGRGESAKRDGVCVYACAHVSAHTSRHTSTAVVQSHITSTQHQMAAPPTSMPLPQAGQSPCSGVHLLYSVGMAY